MTINRLFIGNVCHCMSLCTLQAAAVQCGDGCIASGLTESSSALPVYRQDHQANYCFAPNAPVSRPSASHHRTWCFGSEFRWRISMGEPARSFFPVEHDRTVYTALKPGVMDIFRELPGLDGIQPSLKLMKELPPKVSPDNPSDPKNDYFAVIPAHGDAVASLFEDITFPVNHKMLLRHDPDLRGHRLYVRLQLKQQELSPELEIGSVRPMDPPRHALDRQRDDKRDDHRRPSAD